MGVTEQQIMSDLLVLGLCNVFISLSFLLLQSGELLDDVFFLTQYNIDIKYRPDISQERNIELH